MNEKDTVQTALTAEGLAEGLLPALIPFSPAVKLLIVGIVRAHYNATRTWPSEAEVRAALPAGWQQLQQEWAGWTPSGDGTLKG